jgi:hypothetical protein
MVTAAHGLDASQYTFNYVAGWARQAATPDGPSVEEIAKATGQRVIGATDRILQATQPAATLVGEALAGFAVQVGRPLDAVTLSPRTAVEASDTAAERPAATPDTADTNQRRTASLAVSTWERVTTPALDGAARERQAPQQRSVGQAPVLRR